MQSTRERLRKERRRRRVRLLRFICFCIICAALLAAGWHWVRQPGFAFGSINVEGSDKVTAKDILQISGVQEPVNLFVISPWQVPFAENAAWIRPLFGQLLSPASQPFIEEILRLADLLDEARSDELRRPACLTDNEWKAVKLAASRLSNREIALEMGFSEGTVKQYLNRIYGKLHLEGDARNKRRRLEELFK